MAIVRHVSSDETSQEGFRKVADLGELKGKGRLVVKGGRYGVALFYHQGEVHAIDNRCPHMGFPLHLGTVCDGILTCHWHHARFDLKSGGTFDPWADDVPSYPVEVRGNEVWLNASPPLRDDREKLRNIWRRRLVEGLEQNIGLVIAKSVLALLDLGEKPPEIARIGGEFGTRHRRSGWGSGLTILTAMTTLVPHLDREDQVLALYQGLVHVARDTAGQPPLFALTPLPNDEAPVSTLKAWLRRFVAVRDGDGAERALLTAIAHRPAPADIADMLFGAATDHVYLDGGHTLDFINKAFELLDWIGWEAAPVVLASVARLVPRAARSEEQSAWRHPADLVGPLQQASDMLPEWLAAGRKRREAAAANSGERAAEESIEALLGDEPGPILEALRQALLSGARPTDLARSVAYAAAVRIARFNTQNDFGDWIAVLHTFTYSNALHQALQRVESPELARGLFHGAMRVYLDRFLNVPPARLPWETDGAEEKPGGDVIGVMGAAPEDRPKLADLRAEFLRQLDVRHRVEEAARIVASYAAGGESGALFRTFGRALLREDAEFHTFQMVEAGLRQHAAWSGRPERQRLILVAIARYLAAHSPTDRQLPQVAGIAARLHRGERLYE